MPVLPPAMPSENTQTAQDTPLRWGFSTGAAFCAVAVAAWQELQQGTAPQQVTLEFLDGRLRHIPLHEQRVQGQVTVQKDGGDDPDCTHKALLYGHMRAGSLSEAATQDYILQVGEATLIVQAVEGVGLCTRLGLDCEQGKWAITSGPLRMLRKNMQYADILNASMQSGVWLFRFGVHNGASIAKHSLNGHLGITGGISILGSTGLVRPFSHDAYKATLRICVRSHIQSGGRHMVFCTGGRTKKGAQKQWPQLTETAFACMADFVAFSLRSACAQGMEEVTIACMPGKLCKYAAGHANTHAHTTAQDVAFLQRAVLTYAKEERGTGEDSADLTQAAQAMQSCVTVREALLCLAEQDRVGVLGHLADEAVQALQAFVTGPLLLRVQVYDFQGQYMLEREITVQKWQSVENGTAHEEPSSLPEKQVRILKEEDIDPEYFLRTQKF